MQDFQESPSSSKETYAENLHLPGLALKTWIEIAKYQVRVNELIMQ